MKIKFWLLPLIVALTLLSACGGEDNTEGSSEEITEDDLDVLEVEFGVPEIVDVDETFEMEAFVTYGEEAVEDADEVVFEVWEVGNEEDSEMIDSENHGDGTYTAETVFEQDGVYEMYAHTTARTMHTMPKKSVTVGEGASADQENADEDAEENGFHTDGFGMHFVQPDEVNPDVDTELIVYLQMDEEEFEGADVRYEIWNYDVSDQHDWIDAEESESGEYIATHEFPETGTYYIQIHVEDDDGLHEHEEHEVIINE